jgi:hypothetical protein
MGTTEKSGRETRQAPVTTGATEIEVNPSGLCVSLLRPLLGLIITQVTDELKTAGANKEPNSAALLIFFSVHTNSEVGG